jgi:flagellar basal-body rod modification protein FlgD
MEISGVTNSGVKTQTAGVQTLGKEDFMRLLLKQLSYQDPLNPMDSMQFTAQLTQFSSLEQLDNINKTLDDVLAFQHSMQNASIANLIGKTVKGTGNAAYLNNTADISYNLSGDASSVNISIYDKSGKLVASKEAGPQSEGENHFLWDGIDSFGNQEPEGTYTFEVQAKDSSGNAVSALTNSSGTVTGVVFEDGSTYLTLNGGRKVHLSEIESIQ